ncbi:MAG: siphovirus Gp157 family protein [Patescibacteria group bacterium]
MKKESKEITTIQKESAPIIKEANALEIYTPAHLTQAVSILSELNKFSDRITEEKERVTKPLNEALKAERSRWKPLETQYDGAISLLRTRISAYQTKAVQEAKLAQEKIASRVGEGSGKLKIETALKKLEAIEVPTEQINTQSGSITFREVQRLNIVDETKIPREYLIPDEKRILDALKGGIEIAGCAIEIIQVPYNQRG